MKTLDPFCTQLFRDQLGKTMREQLDEHLLAATRNHLWESPLYFQAYSQHFQLKKADESRSDLK